MKIYYHSWNENSQQDMTEALILLGHEVFCSNVQLSHVLEESPQLDSVKKIIVEKEIELIFSFDFFPVLAYLANEQKRPYLSWIYDMPHRTLASTAVYLPYNFMFCFDYMQAQELVSRNVNQVWHFPLAVNTNRLEQQIKKRKKKSDVSFVGSLYEENDFRKIVYLPEEVKGYLNGIMDGQQQIYGKDILSFLVDEQTISTVSQFVQIELMPEYTYSVKEVFLDMLRAEITCRDRVQLLRQLSDHHKVDLYTNSNASLVPNARKGGMIDYYEQMPQVFYDTKINLNISLRSIQTGIPLRAFDILGAGGFLLSNYQAEFCELFEMNKEVVLYSSKEECLALTSWYLSHDKEREEIACRGWEKVRAEYNYPIRVKKMLDLVGACS